MDTLVFAYYCSGHGYGHATRVSAFARHLLSLSLPSRLTVHIVSSAPRHVFADSITCGALYRYADIDPVIVQPLAYRVDRQKSVQVLEDFLAKKDALLVREHSWLTEIGATCVLSDAAFLGCLAAKSAGIPSILITNFTFDSVYSYLATSLVDSPAQVSTLSPSPTDTSISSTNSDQLLPDLPIPESTLAPLVAQLHEGYQHADLLLRLPGHIPIPSFLCQPALPSSQWVDPVLNKFHSHVTRNLLLPLTTNTPLLPSHPFPETNNGTIPRTVRAAPLLVRPPSPKIYTPEGRADFLLKTGLPNFKGMKILIVSFGGQVFKRPGNSRAGSRIQSRFGSRETLAEPPVEKKSPSSKRSSRDYHALLGHHRPSASLDKLVFKPRDMNAPRGFEDSNNGPRLDIDAVDRSLRTHIKSKFSKYTGRKPTTSWSEKNISDYVSSSDVDSTSGGTNSHPESDHEPFTITSAQQPFFPPTNTTNNNTTTEESIIHTPTTPLSKRRHTLPRRRHDSNDHHRRLATPSHLHIPGAPPASKPSRTLLHTPRLGTKFPATSTRIPEMCIIPPTPDPRMCIARPDTPNTAPILKGGKTGKSGAGLKYTTAITSSASPDTHNCGHVSCDTEEGADDIGLLPDDSWIAVICGVSKEQWNAENQGNGDEGDNGLPEGFYVAPRDVYMPDLIAVGDVVLGKLGYGMTSECVDACTPFVYVSRPLFIEEHGLKMYLNQEGVGVELSRTGYESGEWARSVEEAYRKGRQMKETKRNKEYKFSAKLAQMDMDPERHGDSEARLSERERQGRKMARGVVEWVENVQKIMRQRQQQQGHLQKQVVESSRDIVTAALVGETAPVPVPVLPVEVVEAKGILVT